MSEKRDLLIEIGLEEMPARFVTDSMNQLKEKVEDWLHEQYISFQSVRAFSTPRRLVVFATDVLERQDDREEETRGPAKKVALDAEGHWTRAALGFARGQNVSTDEFFFKEIKGKDYIFIKKFIKGKQTFDLLPSLQRVITALSFPKSMRWNAYALRFIRPIQWILALYGNEVIPMSITGVQADRKTYGHRFLGREVTLETSSDYMTSLSEQYVIADPDQRKQTIRGQLKVLEEENGWRIPVHEVLLEEVNNLVEFPTVLYGTFDPAFLDLPKEVLITSMREHQRYFPVENGQGELLPFFVTLRNGNDTHLENVARGNEKVLRARLSDAQFFWEEDQKMTIADAQARLDNIIFLEKIGTMGDKIQRIRLFAEWLCSFLNIDDQTKVKVDRAAEICKFDLVTHMVDEFSELQGIIGEKYANIGGEDAEVAKAVNEHYQPRFKEDKLPETLTGAVIGTADKMDTIAGCFIAGLIPTGSQDPYGLRRSATGIVRILQKRNWDIPLSDLQFAMLDIYQKKGTLEQSRLEEIKQQLAEFFHARIRTLMHEQAIDYDVIDAVTAGEITDVGYLFARAKLIMKKREEPAFKTLVETLSRVTNIAAKANVDGTDVNSALFQTSKEKQLYEKGIEAKSDILAAASHMQPLEALHALHDLQKPINDYFDHLMVMDEDKQVRTNRVKQMKNLSEIIGLFAHFQTLVL